MIGYVITTHDSDKRTNTHSVGTKTTFRKISGKWVEKVKS